MNEWPGKLSRIDAISIIESITDQDDPAWEWAVEDWYDEDTDTMPSIYEVLATLGVTEDEYKEATGAQNTNWPNFADEQHVAALSRIKALEKVMTFEYWWEEVKGFHEDEVSWLAKEAWDYQQALIEALTAEVEEQARLLGMSGSREAELMARIEALKKAARNMLAACEMFGLKYLGFTTNCAANILRTALEEPVAASQQEGE